MTQTISAELMAKMKDISANELNHHGILGMKWGIRRYQPYPKGYHGEGKYVGPHEEIKKTIDKAKSDAISSGNRRMLKSLKSAMSRDEYKKSMSELSKNGARIKALDGDTSGVKSYKKDLSSDEYKYYKKLSKIVNSSKKLDYKTMTKKLMTISDDDYKAIKEKIEYSSNMDVKLSELRKQKSNKVKEGAKVAGVAAASAAAVYGYLSNPTAAKSVAKSIGGAAAATTAVYTTLNMLSKTGGILTKKNGGGK